MSRTIKRKLKDSIFRHIFNNPVHAVDLYKELSGLALSPDEITPLHTNDVIVQSDLCNDVAFFTRDSRLFALIEHQCNRELRIKNYKN